jgi:carbon starvation protein
MKLWPLFGSANQLLAALALLVVTLYLKRKGGLKFVVTAVPCLVMLVITSFAMVKNEIIFLTAEKYADEKWLLASIGAGIFLLALWMTIEAVVAFFNLRRPASQQRPDVST